jgi:hypothetical protein
MAHDSAFDSEMLDEVLTGQRTADGLLARAFLFRRSAALSWQVSSQANRAIDDAIDSGMPMRKVAELASSLNGDWRLITIAVYQDAVALELALKSIVAKQSSYDAAEKLGHKLHALIVAVANDFPLTDHEERLVWNLDQALLWQGRYPTPLSSQIQKGVHRRPSTRSPDKSNMAGEIHHADQVAISHFFERVSALATAAGVQSIPA